MRGTDHELGSSKPKPNDEHALTIEASNGARLPETVPDKGAHT
jgi:hypothetical protein